MYQFILLHDKIERMKFNVEGEVNGLSINVEISDICYILFLTEYTSCTTTCNLIL